MKRSLKMKFLKKLLVLALSVTMCFSSFACTNGSGSGGDTTVINIMNNGGGCGRVWLDNAIARFQEKIGDKSYAPGKKGVSFEIEHNIQTQASTMATSGFDVYFTTSDSFPYALAQRGLLYDVTEFINRDSYEDEDGNITVSILDKIDPNYHDVLKGADGQFYAIPHEEWFPGLSYDAELFELRNLYFAAPEETNVRVYECDYGTGRFVANAEAKKSSGNDGVYGTYDDGLPSSLLELLILCSRIKNQLSMVPFTVSGRNAPYTNYLLESLWASLSGYDQFMGTYTFDSEMEVVTGYTDEPLFPGVDYIKKPITEKVRLTEETGYLATDNVNRYYASAFMEIMYREGWYSNDVNNNSSHTGAQSNFIFSGVNGKQTVAMLIEGNYWYNESVTCGNFDDYFAFFPNKTERDIRWMPLPTSLTVSATEGNGRDNILLDTGVSYTFINNRTQYKTDGCLDALLDFLTFIYSDEEMSHFTQCTGLGKAAMNYDITEEDWEQMEPFKQSMWELRRNNKVIYGSASNETFRSAVADFIPSQTFTTFLYNIDGRLYICDLYAHRAGYGAQDCFEATRKDLTIWQGVYKGDQTI